VLLGDSIYMDYGLGNHQPNGSPYGEPLDKFSRLMHAAYEAQWKVANFQAAIQKPIVHAIWDDHDFAWNNSRGGGAAAGKDYVAPEYRRLSRLHFETFRKALVNKPAAYPPNPAPSGVVGQDGGSIAQTIELAPDVLLHLLDTRSFREEEGDTSQLGPQQRDQLQAALLAEPGINIIASSSTVKGWKKYDADYDWLRDVAKTHRILVLSGDIHEPDFRTRGRLHEVTASAMAQPPGITAIFGKKTQVFGLLEIEPDRVDVKVFVGAKLVEEHTILRSDWSVE
jgi:alkaline phosphatase D